MRSWTASCSVWQMSDWTVCCSRSPRFTFVPRKTAIERARLPDVLDCAAVCDILRPKRPIPDPENRRNHLMHKSRPLFAFLSILMIALGSDLPADDKTPLKVLIITGGCCHDYPFQTRALQEAARTRGVAVEWTVVNEGGNGTSAQIDLYNNADWAAGYDVVVHNECFAKTTDETYIRKITKPHLAGANAVVIHCAMHTYRDAKIDDWRQMLGVTSRRHEHKSNYVVRNAKPDHPAMKDFPDEWTTPTDELYVIEKVWPHTTVLATSVSEKTGDLHPVIWTNEYGKARVFGTTYGHSNETFEDKVFLDTVINGLRWAAGRS